MKKSDMKFGFAGVMMLLCMLALVSVCGQAFATAHDVTTGYTPGAFTRLQLHSVRGTVDLDTTTVVSNDTVAVVTVPAKYMVVGVITEVETASSSAVTFDVGNSTSATAFSSNISSTNLAVTVSATGEAYSATANDVLLTFDDTPGTNGVIGVEVIMVGPLDR